MKGTAHLPHKGCYGGRRNDRSGMLAIVSFLDIQKKLWLQSGTQGHVPNGTQQDFCNSKPRKATLLYLLYSYNTVQKQKDSDRYIMSAFLDRLRKQRIGEYRYSAWIRGGKTEAVCTGRSGEPKVKEIKCSL